MGIPDAENPPAGHIIDDPRIHLVNARTFSFGPTHDRCYQPPSMQNIANFKLKCTKTPANPTGDIRCWILRCERSC